jgi:hypothetical protein
MQDGKKNTVIEVVNAGITIRIGMTMIDMTTIKTIEIIAIKN